MKLLPLTAKPMILFSLIGILASGCASTPKPPPGLADVRNKLLRMQEDSRLATRAPLAVKEAESAIRDAERPTKHADESEYLVWVADHKVDIASAQAQGRYLEDQRKELSAMREQSRLDSRTQEADQAHREAGAAKLDAALAKEQADELQRQITELNAKATDRGLVVTLGDLLFETDKSELKGSAVNQLGKLTAFLVKYPDRNVVVEGHTDSMGNDDYNLGLSQRRANSVRGYLLSQGIAANRLSAEGKGENFPVTTNDTATGRQLNRRVEIIISETAISMK